MQRVMGIRVWDPEDNQASLKIVWNLLLNNKVLFKTLTLFRELILPDTALRDNKSINQHQNRHLIEISITGVLTLEQFPDEMKG